MSKEICTNCDKGRVVRTNNMCDACCTKDWRRRNPKKVKAYQLMRYQRDRVKILKSSKEWVKNNRERTNTYKREWLAKNKDYQALLDKTKSFFKNTKVKCEDCGSKEKLLFHHLQPLSYDNFQVLCEPCHYLAHAKIRKDKRATGFTGNKKGVEDEKTI